MKGNRSLHHHRWPPHPARAPADHPRLQGKVEIDAPYAVLYVVPSSDRARGMRPFSAVAIAIALLTASAEGYAASETDLFQQAVNYVFTGRIDPSDAAEITDRKACVVVMRDPKFPRYIRYYLSRFNMDTAAFDKIYAGSQVRYELEVKSDQVLLEYLDIDKKTVAQAYRSAHIPLPGDIEQTRKALKIIFTDHCKAEPPKTPF